MGLPREVFPPIHVHVFDADKMTVEAFPLTSISTSSEHEILVPENDYNGWVNPEDLAPMPQCVAQQDQSAWLRTLTGCTGSRCTRHFGVICTHHQWLTQLSCLSTRFSPDIVREYLPYCSRSVLAKAQVYRWIRDVTGRTWLVDVGDANELQYLSPASLGEGYATTDVLRYAPTCLIGSTSASSMEAFPRVMASCSFTSTTQHTGNAARPWEYNQGLRSMIALDFETAGYDLTGRSIEYGDYFDKQCFCYAFTINDNQESCSMPGTVDLTKKRLWMNATCGPASLPANWMDGLRTTDFAYIPIEDWRWPKCAADMPQQVIELAGQCVSDACKPDSSGYCEVVRAVDRACFCRDISYNSCEGLCHIFEDRIDYVNWLHNLCGGVQNWHGLPDDWRHLAVPTTLDMIPWGWTLKASNNSDLTSMIHLGSTEQAETCVSMDWKLGSFALINIATVLAIILVRSEGGILRRLPLRSWVSTGILNATLQLLAIGFNVFLVQNTPGYENIPVTQLTLLWCSVPRLTWLITLPFRLPPFQATTISAAASFLVAEAILQVLSSYYMIVTVRYGWEHNFYPNGMKKMGGATAAKSMYAGALLWLLLIFAFVPLIRVTWRTMMLIGADDTNVPKWQRSEEGNHAVYGTFPLQQHTEKDHKTSFVSLHGVTIVSMLLWIAQWLFWGGFIGLSQDEYVLI